jgi:hypothetical protein
MRTVFAALLLLSLFVGFLANGWQVFHHATCGFARCVVASRF